MDNTALHVDWTRQTLPMLPAHQVLAIIERMRIEQAQMLREQQDAIVAQVMRQLSENGTMCVNAQKGSMDLRSSQHLSVSKLEQSLQSLVLHSLEESGLKYPHVQRGMPPLEQPASEWRSTRPTKKTESHISRKALVVRRQEATDRLEALPDDQESCIQEPTTKPIACAARHKPVPAQITHSPLGYPASGRDSSRKKAKSHRRQRIATADDSEPDIFESVRNKVGHNTLAILDRSRALLDEMKSIQSGRHQTAEGDNTFVHRMREKLAKAANKTPKEVNEVRDASDPTTDVSPPRDRPDSRDNRNQLDRLQSPKVATHCPAETASDVPHAPRADMEILCPPVHSPENEDEWENELARQILTIYATSVKTKQATKRPASHAGSHTGSSTSSAVSRAPPLRASCSLPAIRRAKPSATAAGPQRDRDGRSRSPPRATVQYSWEPSQRLGDGRVVVNMPNVPKPIWFAGTGVVKAVWCAIAEGFQGLHHGSPAKPKPRDAVAVCEHQLCEEVRRLEAKQQYSQCITTLETLLISLVRARGVAPLETKHWKQLVATCNAFASRCVDYTKFAAALQLIQQAEKLLHHSVLVDDAMRLELLAYLYDTYAYYYYRRGKSHAGLQYMTKAHAIHARQSSWTHIAKCRLHRATLLSVQHRHDEALGLMASILALIEDSKLEDKGGESASAQKICLAAVCYNNMAVEQLHLRQFDAASVSTGNATRLARLCLSYSNRWLAQLDATSQCVDLAIATLMEDVNAKANALYKN